MASENTVTVNTQEYRQLLSALDKERRKNASLLRICRERANAERNLRPKKLHSGYVLKSSVQIKTKIPAQNSVTDSFFNNKPIPRPNNSYAWKSVFESPYDNLISFDMAMDLIMGDLDKILMPQLHIKYRQSNDQNGIFRTWQEKTNGQVQRACGIYAWNYSCNQKYWQITLYHTLPLNLQEDIQ